MPSDSFNRLEYAGLFSFPAHVIDGSPYTLVTVPAGKVFVLTTFDALWVSIAAGVPATLDLVRAGTPTSIWFTQPAGGTTELLAGLQGQRVLQAGDSLQFSSFAGANYMICAHGFYLPQGLH